MMLSLVGGPPSRRVRLADSAAPHGNVASHRGVRVVRSHEGGLRRLATDRTLSVVRAGQAVYG